jgi:ribosomal protein S18 acetylase RimI-like enzyme
MTLQSIYDLEPQLAANRRFWAGWAGSPSDTNLPLYRTDIQHVLLNGVLRIRNRPLDEAVEEARKRLAGSTWLWWVGADSDEGTMEGLLARGAEQAVTMPIMAIDVTTVPAFEAPAGLRIQQMSGREEVQEYVRTYAEPLGLGTGDTGPVVEHELNHADPALVRLAGVVDGRTVGTCTLSLAPDLGALYCIATDASYRRQGVATALTVEALRIARESGRRIVTLQATSDGEPVYRRIGFKTVSYYRLFSLPA